MPALALTRYSVLALCLAAPLALAQSGGQTGGNTGGAGTSTKGAPTITTRPNTTTQPPQEERRPVFLSGRVMLDDGTPPTDRVGIERVCNGSVRREAYTDSHGQFGFQLGSDAQVFQDATADSSFDMSRSPFGTPNSGSANNSAAPSPFRGFSMRELMGCELRANLPGFHSDTISLAGRQAFDNPDVGTIVLHRMGKVEGTRISMTTLKAPNDAKKAFKRGMNLLKDHKQAPAAEQFAKAVALYPNYAEALLKLGEIEMDDGRGGDAEKLFQQAIQADAQFMPPYFDLALLAARKQDWKQMVNLTDRALALNAYEYPAAYYFNAVANYNLHQYDQAEKSARMARRLDSQYQIPKIDIVLANVFLQRQDYAGAAAQLRTFLKYSPSGPDAAMARELLGETESKLATAAPR